MSQETAFSILFTLMQRHEDAAKYYRQLQQMVDRDEFADWFGELAEQREDMGKTMREFLEQSPPIPVRNKSREDTQSLLHRQWDKVEAAANQENWLEIIRMSRENEEALSSFYQTSMGSEGIPEGIRDLLQKQHKKLVESNRRGERLEKIPLRDRKQ